MGCGKSKHAVETATTIVKSTNPDGTKETSATKTVTEKGDSSLVQKEVETKSMFVEDTKKETVTTKVDPSDIVKTDNVGPTLEENVEKAAEVLNKDEKVKDSNPTDASDAKTDNVVAPTSADVGKATEVVKEDEKVDDFSPTDVSDVNTDNVVPTSTKDDVGITEVVKEDEENIESTPIEDNKAKTDNVPPIEDEETKEFNLTKDNKAKTEFMTPTLSEDIAGPFQVVSSEEVKDYNENNIASAIPDEKSVETIDDSSNPKEDNLNVEEQNVVAPAAESTKVKTKKVEEEDIEVTEADIANEITSPATESEKVPTADEANAEETQEKKP